MTMKLASRIENAGTSDADLVAAAIGGDDDRFATLVRRHNQTLFRACRAVLHDDTEAEDAVQTAWLRVYRALGSFRGDAAFRTWATRIAVNEASTRLRGRRRLSLVSLEDTMAASGNPEFDASTAELGRLLERNIDALPEGMRAVLVLRDVIELDTAETAACLGIAEEAVRVRLHRARHTLAESLTEQAATNVWRFDGDRCSRVQSNVMAAIKTRGSSTR
jgi:RNA polymerase sigma-70 factor (ECF subfamily)